MTSQVRIYPTRNDVARATAVQVVEACDKAQTTRGRFTIALSGGSTPRDLYRLLATEEYASAFDWQRIHVFWSDERCVPLNSPDNNAYLARDILLNHVPISISNIHRVQSDLEPEAAAQEYEQTLRNYFAARSMQLPQFDLLLLGLGADAHTASLFPGSEALHERERWSVATYVDKLESWRVTLTPIALNAASRIVFMVVGEEKAEALKHVLSEPKKPDLYPAQIIDPPQGQVLWIADNPAAALLNS